MQLKEHEPIGPKTTMRIGGTARYFAELKTRQDVEEAVAFAQEQKLPLILLGGGSNTLFTDDEVNALVVRIKADATKITGDQVRAEAGTYLATLINQLAAQGLDLSPLTGIPGSLGGAVFGNAGQGPQGIWINQYVESVTAYVDGAWKTFTKEECRFRYRESMFKDQLVARNSQLVTPPLIWSTTLRIPSGDPATIKAEIEALLKKRIETQPHLKTAGSCFKAVGGTPAWKLIDAAGLRGKRFGGVEISEKHSNFLLNVERGSFADAAEAVNAVRTKISEPLEVEMRFIQTDGSAAF